MKIICADALVVGTGAAGFSAACRIAQDGRKQVTMVTEGVLCGTSRNTGSDKQTYYKLGLSGDCPDSVYGMARNLFDGGGVDGDHALCEAALSVRCFLNLVELGVPFPVNRYGEYVGYKTDHDPYARATSAGPLTSKFMTQALESKAKELKIPIYDGFLAIEVLKGEDGVCGLLCLDLQTEELVAFQTGNIVLATGGPAGIYADSVYPVGHTGSSSLAFSAGAHFQNMTHWQYGLASTEPRWNVSGTYMQVLPRFVSVDESGVEREFLLDYYTEPEKALSAVFLKGYQWPFDSAKARNGSSVIDLLVYREMALFGRKVYLDYRANPFGLLEIPYEKLSEEAYSYLKNAGGCFGTPIERLNHMNQPAVELYRGKGVDLAREMLPIALCAQHHNGGISVDLWWQTHVPGLFAAGECAGTHGIARPGGSALNAGQVGALRAAQYICQHGRPIPESEAFARAAESAAERQKVFLSHTGQNPENVTALLESARNRMSVAAGAVRRKEKLQETLDWVKQARKDLGKYTGGKAAEYYRCRDALICQQILLEAMLDYCRTANGTKGSALYTDPEGDEIPGLDAGFSFVLDPQPRYGQIQEGVFREDRCQFLWRDVRPIPENEDVFETVWRSFRENRNVY